MRGSSIVVGVIVERSVDVPSLPDLIDYTIEIDEEGVPVQYEGVTPNDSDRISTQYPDFNLELVPFEIGQEVPVGVRTIGGNRRLRIMRGEFVAIEECGQ